VKKGDILYCIHPEDEIQRVSVIRVNKETYKLSNYHTITKEGFYDNDRWILSQRCKYEVATPELDKKYAFYIKAQALARTLNESVIVLNEVLIALESVAKMSKYIELAEQATQDLEDEIENIRVIIEETKNYGTNGGKKI